MTKMQITEAEYHKMQRQIAKLDALESGGVDNWDWYGESLKEWRAENEVDELFDTAIGELNDIIAESEVEEPAGRGAGYAIHIPEKDVRAWLSRTIGEHAKIIAEKDSD